MPVEQKHWFTAIGHRGKQWEVCLATPDALLEEWDENPILGITIPAKALILVSAAQPRRQQDVIAIHELLHASINGRNPIGEEEVVTEIAPRLLPMIRQFGFRLPPRPRGCAAFERQARREERAT